MTTTVAGTDSAALVHFRVDYKQFTELAARKFLISDEVSLGGQLWQIYVSPRGIRAPREHTGIFLRHLNESSSDVRAIFEPFFLDKDGGPSLNMTKLASIDEYDELCNNGHRFYRDGLAYPEFCRIKDIEGYVVDGHITFVCAIVVLNELGLVPVPPSDIGNHLGHLLDTQETSDVSFLVGGETFHAHRLVLAARSPVFKAQLFGSMIEATVPSAPITLHEIAPATFRVLLRFIYTDSWPRDDELGDSPLEMLQDLLAAADLYALDRLKLMCARKLCGSVSVDTVATILACAETYGCLELKKKCLDFCMVKKKFKKVASTDGYALLERRFPSITAEIREKSDTEKEHEQEEDSSSSESGSSSSEDEESSSDDDDGDDDNDNEDDDEDDEEDDDDDDDDDVQD